MDEIKWDLGLQWLKRLQRRWHASSYADEELRRRWLLGSSRAPYRVVSLPVEVSPDSVRSLLIYKPDEIGDAVQSLPAIAELRRHFSKARFFLLCQPKTQPLYERTGLFDEIVAAPVRRRFASFSGINLGALSRFSVRRFDLAFFLRTYPSYFRQFLKVPADRLVSPIDPRMPSVSPYRLPVSQWGSERRHQSLQLLELVGPFTGRKYELADVAYPPFHWKDEDREGLAQAFGDKVPDRYFVVHPFATFETKRYPLESWRILLGLLRRDFGVPIVVVGGAEDPVFEGEGLIPLQGKITLSQTAYLISKAKAFLGNESGPAHLASALGIPTVTLMGGHSFPVEWAPLGKSLVLRMEVPCGPCHRRVCPGYGLACLTQLNPLRLYPQIKSFL